MSDSVEFNLVICGVAPVVVGVTTEIELNHSVCNTAEFGQTATQEVKLVLEVHDG